MEREPCRRREREQERWPCYQCPRPGVRPLRLLPYFPADLHL